MKPVIVALLLVASIFSYGQSTVQMITNQGTLVIELYDEQAPITVENFLAYSEQGFYEGLIIHRVVPGFVVQGGGYDQSFSLRQPTLDNIENESDNGLSNERGTLSMARRTDPDSANSQFFINLADNRNLDANNGQAGYAVFARVIEGMDIVDQWASADTKTTRLLPGMPTPVTPIIIERIEPLP